MNSNVHHTKMGTIRGREMVKEAMQLPADVGGVVMLGLERQAAREKESFVGTAVQAVKNIGQLARYGAKQAVKKSPAATQAVQAAKNMGQLAAYGIKQRPLASVAGAGAAGVGLGAIASPKRKKTPTTYPAYR